MSHAARKTDAEKTAVMLDLVHRLHESGRTDLAPAYVVIEEVSPGTGWGASRYADVVALSTWPSRGLRLEGFELKASRADLRRELADPGKHQAIARYCDEWSLVVWDRAMLEGLDIPPGWGVYTVDEERYELETFRKASRREPEPWPRAFVCSLVRNAHMQSPRAAFIARAVIAAEKAGQKNAEDVAWREVEHTLRPLAKALGFDTWNDPGLEKLVRLAVDDLARLKEALKSAGKPEGRAD